MFPVAATVAVARPAPDPPHCRRAATVASPHSWCVTPSCVRLMRLTKGTSKCPSSRIPGYRSARKTPESTCAARHSYRQAIPYHSVGHIVASTRSFVQCPGRATSLVRRRAGHDASGSSTSEPVWLGRTIRKWRWSRVAISVIPSRSASAMIDASVVPEGKSSATRRSPRLGSHQRSRKGQYGHPCRRPSQRTPAARIAPQT